jgi:transcriptional regulator with XRE-family HTH domain
LGNALRSLRQSQGLTQDELARRSDVHVTSLRDYEQGRTAPSWHTLTKIAYGLGIPMAGIGQVYDRSSVQPEPRKIGRPTGKRSAPRT